MTADIAVRSTTDLSIDPDQQFWTDKQTAALRQLGVNDASNADLAVFFHQVKRTGLDPFARQIYMIGRREKDANDNWITKQTIQTGIDGYRLVARRAADREGEKLSQSEPLWCGKDMVWREAWISDEPPAAAKVVVYRDGEPFPGVAMYREFVQTRRDGKPNSMWSRMPANQLAKCAEALALRKAFPQDLGGIYTEEEMGQAERAADGAHVVTSVPSRRVTASEITGEVAKPPAEEPAPERPQRQQSEQKATQAQMSRIHAMLKDHDIESDDGVRKAIGEILNRQPASRTTLTKADADTVIGHLEKLAPPAPGGEG